MQVSVEKSDDIERKLTISVPSSEIEAEIKKRLQGMANKARIPGFRPGKAPMSIIQKNYLPQVTQEVINDIINSSYVDALGQEKIVPAGLLSIDSKPYQSGKDFEYVAIVELFPEIPSPTLGGQPIQQIQVEITDEDVKHTLKEIRKRAATYEEKDTPAEDEDFLTIDFEGTIEGKEFAGGSGTDFRFLLGKGAMLKEFDESLRGVKTGDSKQIKLTFPENYGDNALNGKKAIFEVRVKKVEVARLPRVDAALAEKLGLKGDVKKMKEEIRQNLDRERISRQRTVMRDRVMDILYAVNNIPVPKGLIDNEFKRLSDAVNQQKKSTGHSTNETDVEGIRSEAERRVRMGLIARAVIEKFDIKVDEQAIRQRITEMAASYEDSEAFISWQYSAPERLSEIQSALIEEQVVEKLLQTASVVEKNMSFQELVRLGAGV